MKPASTVFFYLTFLTLVASTLSAKDKKPGVYEALELYDREKALLQEIHEVEESFLEKGIRYRDPAVAEWIDGIGRKLTPEVKDPYIKYRFYVVRNPVPNAFGLPDGQIYVTTGMLATLENEAQLAGVLAHEIQHVAGHHGFLAFRSLRKKAIVKTVIGSLGAVGAFGDYSDLAVNLSNHFLQLSLAGYERRLEEEADELALRQLRKGGYDLGEMPRAFEVLTRNPEGEPTVTTKWSSRDVLRSRGQAMSLRVAHLLSEADPVVGRESYQLMTGSIALLTVADCVRQNHPRTAADLARRLVEHNPDSPRAWLALGDSVHALGPRSEEPEKDLPSKATRKRLNQTRDERLRELLRTPKGKKNLEENAEQALEAYRRALELEDRLPEIHLGLGHVYRDLHRPKEAARAFMTFLDLAPDSPEKVLIMDELRSLREELIKMNGGTHHAKKTHE